MAERRKSLSSMRAADRAGMTLHAAGRCLPAQASGISRTGSSDQSWDNRERLGRVYHLPEVSRALVIRPNQYPGGIEMDAETQFDVPEKGKLSAILLFRGIGFEGVNFQGNGKSDTADPAAIAEPAYTVFVQHGGATARLELTTKEPTLFVKVFPTEAKPTALFSGEHPITDGQISFDPNSMRVEANNGIVTVTYNQS